jgi:hypothetical protein
MINQRQTTREISHRVYLRQKPLTRQIEILQTHIIEYHTYFHWLEGHKLECQALTSFSLKFL